MFDPRHVEVLRRWEEAASEEEREDLRKALRVLARSQEPNKQVQNWIHTLPVLRY